MDSFEFENGEVLNDVTVEYMAFGTPVYDENDNISNAIVYCHGSLGNYSGIKSSLRFLAKGTCSMKTGTSLYP